MNTGIGKTTKKMVERKLEVYLRKPFEFRAGEAVNGLFHLTTDVGVTEQSVRKLMASFSEAAPSMWKVSINRKVGLFHSHYLDAAVHRFYPKKGGPKQGREISDQCYSKCVFLLWCAVMEIKANSNYKLSLSLIRDFQNSNSHVTSPWRRYF